MIFLAKSIPTKAPQRLLPPGQSRYDGEGAAPFGIPWGPWDPRPRTQEAVALDAYGELNPFLQTGCGLSGKEQKETACPSAHLALQAAKENNKTFPCLMIEITLKVVEMP